VSFTAHLSSSDSVLTWNTMLRSGGARALARALRAGLAGADTGCAAVAGGRRPAWLQQACWCNAWQGAPACAATARSDARTIRVGTLPRRVLALLQPCW
jgi:hypothetical protein